MKAQPSASLAYRTIRGAGWVVLWRAITRTLGVVSTIVLARILVPADYGLVAIATTYVAIFDALSEVGLQDAIVRTEKVDRSFLDTAFTLATIRGTMNGIIVAASAFWASAFFSESRLRSVLLVISLFPVLEGFENIGITEFRRDFRFDKEFQLFLLPRLMSISASITAAIILRSYWALVIGLAVLRLSRFILTYWIHPFRPRFGLSEWRRLIGFSSWTWAIAVVSFAKDRSWAMILGRLFDTFSVGVFMLAWEIALLPLTEFISPVCRALFSGFAAARKEGLDLGDAFTRTVAIVAVPILPAAIGISATSAYIINFAVGPKWSSAIPILEWVAAAAPFTIAAAVGWTALAVSGHLRPCFIVISVTACLTTLFCWFMASEFGLKGAAQALAACLIFEGLAYASAIATRFNIRFTKWPGQLWRPALATAVMALVLWRSGYGWVDTGVSGSVLIDCFCAVIIGCSTYASVLLGLWALVGLPKGAEAYLLAYARHELRLGWSK